MSCGHRFEARQGFNDEPVAQCPTCGERSERLITAVAVHFKGSGFYKTDYKSGNGRAPSNGNGKASESKTDGTGEATSSSKASKESGKASADKASSDKSPADKSSSDRSSPADSGSKAKSRESAARPDG
jgi:putative FmdB family regulatory protein